MALDPLSPLGAPPGTPPRAPRLHLTIGLAPSRKRGKLSPRAIAARARWIARAKLLLPSVGVVLIGAVILWPEFNRIAETSRRAIARMGAVDPFGGNMLEPHYRGVDARDHAYTVTASLGRQAGPDVVNLVRPIADTTLQNGAWVMIQADRGVYLQHQNILDLEGHVQLYRDDGTFLWTHAATIDLKQGFASGQTVVSAEGPFGTLDAFGFALADKGALIQFAGPARLILNAQRGS